MNIYYDNDEFYEDDIDLDTSNSKIINNKFTLFQQDNPSKNSENSNNISESNSNFLLNNNDSKNDYDYNDLSTKKNKHISSKKQDNNVIIESDNNIMNNIKSKPKLDLSSLINITKKENNNIFKLDLNNISVNNNLNNKLPINIDKKKTPVLNIKKLEIPKFEFNKNKGTTNNLKVEQKIELKRERKEPEINLKSNNNTQSIMPNKEKHNTNINTITNNKISVKKSPKNNNNYDNSTYFIDNNKINNTELMIKSQSTELNNLFSTIIREKIKP